MALKCILLFLVAAPMCVFLARAFGPAGSEGTGHRTVERYTYRAVPADSEEEDSRGEAVEIEIMEEAEVLRYVSRVTSVRAREETSILMDRKGSFLSGTRTLLDGSGKTLQRDRLTRNEGTMTHEKAAGRVTTEEIDLPRDTMLAVDGTLLVLLRSFPFGNGGTWNVFMVDFSGTSITVALRQAGTEAIETPAGRFECYRIEAIVNIPLLRPRITYWLAKERPHYLVKSVGKRGPFTASYETTLISKGRSDSPQSGVESQRLSPFPQSH